MERTSPLSLFLRHMGKIERKGGLALEGQRTPLYGVHLRLGARMVGFGGWEMPVQYAGVTAEHRAVREAAGLFDASHMGEIAVAGPGALEFLQGVCCANVAGPAGRVFYSPVCLASGGVLDDVLVYRLDGEEFLVVVNAGNRDKDVAWLKEAAPGRVTVEDRSAEWALLALQGPAAAGILAPLAGTDLGSLGYYRARRRVAVAGVRCLLSRTGYTGEDGFELYCSPADAAGLFETLLEAGAAPAGLGARDTLRLEAALPLYGNELTEETTPLEAGLSRFVCFDKGDFSGRAALVRQRGQGLGRRLAGFELAGPGIARHGYALVHGGREVGTVTSGTLSPTLGRAIGLAYVPPGLPGEELAVVIRGRECPARLVATPFYRRAGTRS